MEKMNIQWTGSHPNISYALILSSNKIHTVKLDSLTFLPNPSSLSTILPIAQLSQKLRHSFKLICPILQLKKLYLFGNRLILQEKHSMICQLLVSTLQLSLQLFLILVNISCLRSLLQIQNCIDF